MRISRLSSSIFLVENVGRCVRHVCEHHCTACLCDHRLINAALCVYVVCVFVHSYSIRLYSSSFAAAYLHCRISLAEARISRVRVRSRVGVPSRVIYRTFIYKISCACELEYCAFFFRNCRVKFVASVASITHLSSKICGFPEWEICII